MRFRGDETAASGQVVALLVAGAIFLAAVGTVLVMGQGAVRDASEPRTAAKHLQATGLADLLVGSTGVGWEDGADGIDRLGLLAGNGSGLDAESLDALRGAMVDAADNGKVDYEEALVSLGMDPDGPSGFHLRIYPVGLEELAVPSDLRVGYVGDWTSLVSVKVALPIGSQEQMAAKANVQLNNTMMVASAWERQALRDLGVDFTDRVYITAATPTILVDYSAPLPDLPLLTVLNVPVLEGDVYPDHEDYLEEVLPDRLDEYDILVVGSGVDHEALDDKDIREGLADWVNAGGHLVVFGSADMDDDWLKDLLKTGVSTVNGAPTAPDAAHPMLKEPNVLAWTDYDSFDLGWDIKSQGSGADYSDFSHIVIQDGEDVLAMSNEGVFAAGSKDGDDDEDGDDHDEGKGNDKDDDDDDEEAATAGGRVVLTTYRPRDVAQTLGQDEAEAFIENILTYSDRSSLYLDYGGTVPADQPVALAVRQSWLWDDVYGQVPVRIEVLAWG